MSLFQVWLRKNPIKPAVYKCKTHGDIGADVVILQGNNTSPASPPVCHRCLAEWLGKRFGVKEILP
jgi:hypothetical protein